MGLDMYLTRKSYVGLNYKNEEIKKNSKLIINDQEIDISNLKYLEFEGCYWRKANQIHNFFVNEVQDGVDDCGTYYVDKETLKKLMSLCKKDINYLDTLKKESTQEVDFFTKKPFTYYKFLDVDESKIELQPTGGFFFGSQEYDKYYYEDLVDTIKEITNLITLYPDDEFYYQSSW